MISTTTDYKLFRVYWRYQDETDLPLYIEVLSFPISETQEYDATDYFAKHQIIGFGDEITITDEHRNPVQSEIEAFKQMSDEDQKDELIGIYDEIYRRLQDHYEECETQFKLSQAGLI